MTRHEQSHSSSAEPGATVVVTVDCSSSSCPTVYRTADGSYLVQGRPVTPESVGIEIPNDEALVQIPESLVKLLREGGRRID